MSIQTDTAIVGRVRVPASDDKQIIIEATDAYDEAEIHARCDNCGGNVEFCAYGEGTRYDFTGAFNLVQAAAKRHAKACGQKPEARK